MHMAGIRLEREKKLYTKTIIRIQNRCPHIWKYYSDPSGNNDSGYICEICRLFKKKI